MAPLSGVRVLDIANFYAAPLVASLLGDFGAEVIKVEPPTGDLFRGNTLWPMIMRNKKSVTLDFANPEDCATLRELIATADVVVENYSDAWKESRGLDWAALSAANPRLIMLSLSCFGQSGPYAGRPGNGSMGEAFGGFTHMTGPEDGTPVIPSLPLGDAVGALSAAYGVVSALYWRDAGGGTGQRIDASLYEPMLQVMAPAIARWTPQDSPRRLGNRMPESFLRNIFPTSDGRYLLIALSTKRKLVEFMELVGAEPDADPEATAEAWTSAQSLDEVMAICEARGMLAMPVNSIDDLLADPHIAARGNLLHFQDAVQGAFMLPAPAPGLSASPGAVGWTGAAAGAHNAEILGALPSRQGTPAAG